MCLVRLTCLRCLAGRHAQFAYKACYLLVHCNYEPVVNAVSSFLSVSVFPYCCCSLFSNINYYDYYWFLFYFKYYLPLQTMVLHQVLHTNNQMHQPPFLLFVSFFSFFFFWVKQSCLRQLTRHLLYIKLALNCFTFYLQLMGIEMFVYA